jgi:pyrroline-5-carboxylate reductase
MTALSEILSVACGFTQTSLFHATQHRSAVVVAIPNFIFLKGC